MIEGDRLAKFIKFAILLMYEHQAGHQQVRVFFFAEVVVLDNLPKHSILLRLGQQSEALFEAALGEDVLYLLWEEKQFFEYQL